MNKTYDAHLVSVLLFGDLSGTFLVLVGLHDLVLQFLEFVGLRADPFDFFLPAFVLNLEASHLAGKLVFNLGGLGGH